MSDNRIRKGVEQVHTPKCVCRIIRSSLKPKVFVAALINVFHLASSLAPRRWLAARSSNTSKFITTIGVCTARLVIKRRASLKPAIVKEKKTFSKKKLHLLLFRMRNVVQNRKRNK